MKVSGKVWKEWFKEWLRRGQDEPDVVSIVMAVEFNCGLGEVAKGVEGADVGAWVFGDFGFESSGVEFGEECVHADNGDAE